MNKPVVFVVATLAIPVATLLSVTRAPGIATRDAFVTMPETIPSAACAFARRHSRAIRRIIHLMLHQPAHLRNGLA